MTTFREQMRGFPLWQMAVISMMRFSEPISFTSLFPYIYFMIRDFHITKDPSQIFKYSGLLAASFAFSQFLCCIHWARLSDRIGRKPVLLTGLCGTAASLVLFGFSKNFYVALAARTAAGALNGNIAVLQTLVGELVKERRHQGLAFATLPLFWNVGCVIGPLIGGSRYLTRPRPEGEEAAVVGWGSFYESFITKHPYALSNVVVASMLFTSALIGFLFLEETHVKIRNQYDVGLAVGDSIRRLLGYTIPVRPWEQHVSSKTHVAADGSAILDDSESANEASPLSIDQDRIYAAIDLDNEEDDQLITPLGLLTRRSSLAVVRRYSSAYSLQPTILTMTAASENEEHISIWAALGNKDIFTYKVIGTLLAYFSIAFHSLIYTEFVPVFLAGTFQKESLSFPWHVKGGLGWQTQDIGSLLSTVGLMGCFMVIVIFPHMDRHMRTIDGFRLACCMFPIAYFLLPYIIFTSPGYSSFFPPWFYKAFLYMNSMIAVVGSSLAFPQVTILVYRATKPKHRALVNATSMSANSLARFVAPMTWGALTSFFDKRGITQVTWNLLALIAVLSVVLAFQLDEYSEDIEDEEEQV
ncbi:MFS general substrate transporter [Metschnikowia bicuspidata var. bicuspidata NRRL YB-4993]|uniref:MFS general substrate transporter n=1 Tax=Metschnikowia bicuspidata var. bicuspidata NRRL YB-4993 TaxID=869754 RepID=A0A1A0H563_9ASCO|nr:MFS general substrate transporter [Metschnikowia bicuspidata var. bicuspidata NRRL YB-4993]OBA19219.1 MFS general substrate transporter [Metschnikowia bicuspidata var. bicuspidata NRRL YB-4993]